MRPTAWDWAAAAAKGGCGDAIAELPFAQPSPNPDPGPPSPAGSSPRWAPLAPASAATAPGATTSWYPPSPRVRPCHLGPLLLDLPYSPGSWGRRAAASESVGLALQPSPPPSPPPLPAVLITEDASVDARFAGNPYVAGDPHIKFYVRRAAAVGLLCALCEPCEVLQEGCVRLFGAPTAACWRATDCRVLLLTYLPAMPACRPARPWLALVRGLMLWLDGCDWLHARWSLLQLCWMLAQAAVGTTEPGVLCWLQMRGCLTAPFSCPLCCAGGVRYGTLCVVDLVPRSFSAEM